MRSKLVLLAWSLALICGANTAISQASGGDRAPAQTPKADADKKTDREFTVPVAEYSQYDATNPVFQVTGRKAKVVLGPKESFGGIGLAPDLKSVSIDGTDMEAESEPVDTIKESFKTEANGRQWCSAYKLKTKRLGTIIAMVDKEERILRVLLAKDQVAKLSGKGKSTE